MNDKFAHKIYVFKGTPIMPKRYANWLMWRGLCKCGKEWQFHFFGATLGYGLEHQRRSRYGQTGSA